MATLLSAIILTKNEGHQLAECLATLTWADEVLVVDSFSTDQTVEVARAAMARVLQHPFANFAAQHNYAQAQAAHDWVLFVDADERVSPELAEEIKRLAEAEQLARHAAYHIQRLHLRSGIWVYTDPATRLFTPRLADYIRRSEVPRLLDRRAARWERALHEVVRVEGSSGVLAGVLYHYAGTNLSASLEDFNDFTDLEAALLHHQGRRVSVLGAVARGLRTFLYHYGWQGWLRYGEHGLLMALQAGMTKFTNYAKLWERRRIERNQGLWIERDRELLQRFDVNPEHEAE